MKRGSFEIGEKDDIHGNNCKITIRSNILMIIQWLLLLMNWMLFNRLYIMYSIANMLEYTIIIIKTKEKQKKLNYYTIQIH